MHLFYPAQNLVPSVGLPLPILQPAKQARAACPGSSTELCVFPTATAETLPALPGIPLRMPARLGKARRFTLCRFSMERYLFFMWSGITRSAKSLLWTLGTSERPSCFSNTSLNPSWINAWTVTTRQSTQSIRANLTSILFCWWSRRLPSRDKGGISLGLLSAEMWWQAAWVGWRSPAQGFYSQPRPTGTTNSTSGDEAEDLKGSPPCQ